MMDCLLLPIRDWVREHEPGDEMLWSKAAHDQWDFMAGRIAPLLAYDSSKRVDESRVDSVVRVISSHVSKSIELPVYYVKWRGVKFYLRANFYDWKVSVDASNSLLDDVDFEGLFKDRPIMSACCEGFDKDWVFGTRSKDRRRFTVELVDKFDVWCFFRKVKRAADEADKIFRETRTVYERYVLETREMEKRPEFVEWIEQQTEQLKRDLEGKQERK